MSPLPGTTPPPESNTTTNHVATNSIVDNQGDDQSQASILEDILPSFQMHNYMFNRPVYDAENESFLPNDELPEYQSELNTLNSIRRSLTNYRNSQDLNTFSINNNNNNNRNNNNTTRDLIENPNLLLLNNVDKLPTVKLPIETKIVLTKKQPMIGKLFERESPLTQYRPGDVITGYVTIKSTIDKPIPFDNLLVSLEGELKTPNGGLKTVDRKILNKTFLKMYDINACYHNGHIPLMAHGLRNPTRLQHDTIDDTVIGFDETKRVLPSIIHKKFFTFKLPNNLLDTTCPEQLHEHLNLLPSYGFDYQSLGDIGEYENMDVDPVLGYKRCEQVYGSPIRVNDMALKGQSISYYIKVQMIGLSSSIEKLNLDIKLPKDLKYPYVVFTNENHHFRVDVSKIDDNLLPNNNLFDNDRMIETNIRTYEQLTNFENSVIRSIAEFKTKRQLTEAGVINKFVQDEMIAELEIDETKKHKQLASSTNFHSEIIRSDNSHFLHYDSLSLTKDFLNRNSGGEIIIKASMLRNSKIHSVKSFALKAKHHNSKKPSNNLTNVFSSDSSKNISGRTSSVPIKSTDSTSDESLSTVKSLQSLKQVVQDHCFVELNLKFIPENKNANKHDLPSSIHISPELKSINIYSTYPIPVSLDGEFLMDQQLLQYTIPNIRKQYDLYLTELKKLATVGKVPIPRTFYNSVNSLSKLSVKEACVPRFEFIGETINLTNKWKYNNKEKIYETNIRIPLAMNSKQISKSTICLVPTFQSCLVNQFYMVHFHVSTKRSKRHCVFKFPLTVV